MPIPILYRLSRLGTWITSVSGLQVLQADQAPNLDRRGLAYVGLSRLPGGWDGARPRRAIRLGLETSWALAFTGVGAGEPAGLYVAGELVEVEGLAGAAARDAWLVAFAATYLSADGWVTAAASGATGVALATGSGWAPPAVEAGQQIVITPSTIDAEIWATPVVTRWRLQVYGSASPEGVLAGLRRAWEADPPPGLRGFGVPSLSSLPYAGGREIRGYVDVDLALDDLYAAEIEGLADTTLTSTLPEE